MTNVDMGFSIKEIIDLDEQFWCSGGGEIQRSMEKVSVGISFEAFFLLKRA